MSYWWPRIIGGVIGASITIYAFIYLPMRANYAECGKVTLCHL